MTYALLLAFFRNDFRFSAATMALPISRIFSASNVQADGNPRGGCSR